jgi:hypothetical protein
VKLTQRGRDFLKAVLFGTIISSLLDVRVVIALCLSLVLAAVISEIILASATTGSIRIELGDPHLTCFKDGTAVEDITVKMKRQRFVRVRVSSVKGPRSVEAIPDETESPSDQIRITFRPKYAGRFEGLYITFEFIDPLGLFRKTLQMTRDDFVIDIYPSSLLKEVRQSAPISLALGERAGRTHGSGQEFYSIDEYNSSIERKNIYWKKIASLPDERLLVKVREANIPQSLSIGLVKTIERDQTELQWMDLACEGAANLGTNIFSLGCDVILLFFFEGTIIRCEASDPLEFRECLMQMSSANPSDKERTSEILDVCDICVTGFKELQDDLLAQEVARKPALIIKDPDAFPAALGNLAVIYSGSDIGELVNRVVRR